MCQAFIMFFFLFNLKLYFKHFTVIRRKCQTNKYKMEAGRNNETYFLLLFSSSNLKWWNVRLDGFVSLTRLEMVPSLSFRRLLLTWKTSTIFSVSALSSRFHRAQNIPERDEPSLWGQNDGEDRGRSFFFCQ